MTLLMRIAGAGLVALGTLGLLYPHELAAWLAIRIPTGRKADLTELLAGRGIHPVEWCGILPLALGLVLLVVGAPLMRRPRRGHGIRLAALGKAGRRARPDTRATRRRSSRNVARLWAYWLRAQHRGRGGAYS